MAFMLGGIKFTDLIFRFARLLQRQFNDDASTSVVGRQSQSLQDHLKAADGYLQAVPVYVKLSNLNEEVTSSASAKYEAQRCIAEAALRLAYAAAQAGLLDDNLLPAIIRRPNTEDQPPPLPEEDKGPHFFG